MPRPEPARRLLAAARARRNAQGDGNAEASAVSVASVTATWAPTVDFPGDSLATLSYGLDFMHWTDWSDQSFDWLADEDIVDS